MFLRRSACQSLYIYIQLYLEKFGSTPQFKFWAPQKQKLFPLNLQTLLCKEKQVLNFTDSETGESSGSFFMM